MGSETERIQHWLFVCMAISQGILFIEALQCHMCHSSANDTCSEGAETCEEGVCWVTKQSPPSKYVSDGKIKYDKGCRKTCPASTLHTTASCCDTELCNNKFVLQTPRPLTVDSDIRLPLHLKCHKCGDNWYRQFCTQGTEECTGVCYVTKEIISGAPFYTHGCKRSCPLRDGVNGYCCNKDLCNAAAEDPGENIGSDYRKCYYSQGSDATDPNRKLESVACEKGFCYINKHRDAMSNVRYYKGCAETCPDNSTSSQYFCCIKDFCNADFDTMIYSINTVREIECARCQNGNKTCGINSETCHGTCYTTKLGGELYTKGCRSSCLENKETSCCNTNKCNKDYNVVNCEYCVNESDSRTCNKTTISCDGQCFTTTVETPKGKLFTKGCRTTCENKESMVNAETTECCSEDLCNQGTKLAINGVIIATLVMWMVQNSQ